MARQLRVEYSGAIYHVTCRMIGDRRSALSRLFVDDKDRARFLERLSERVEQYNIRLYLFACMTNHFHLVFETPEGNCSKFMQSLSTAYTVYYNLRHNRHGHLFDGRYKAKLVEGDDYLLALSRYVHLNPVHVGALKSKSIEGRVELLQSYPWSSYQSYIGKRKAFSFVEYGPILSLMHGKRSQWGKHYRKYVETGLAEGDKEFKAALKESPRSIGGDGFRGRIDELYQKLIEGSNSTEDISFRHITEPLCVDVILETVAGIFEEEVDAFKERRRNSPLRAVAAKMLMRFGGQTQRKIASHLEMGTGGAVSAQVRKLPGLLTQNRRLVRKIKQVEKKLEMLKEER